MNAARNLTYATGLLAYVGLLFLVSGALTAMDTPPGPFSAYGTPLTCNEDVCWSRVK